MSKEVEIIVTAKDKASETFDKIGKSSSSFADKVKANLWAIRVASWIATTALIAIWKKFVDDANNSIEQETKLTTILKQRTNATDEQVDAIKRMTSAQQKLWILEDDMQVAWLQQLWTFVTQTKSLEVLWPAMNNLIAQQKGFNATQGDAINIWNLMWKVLQWQTSALTRVWISFTDAQEKVLKFWTESERSAMLAQVITDNVWNMNEALADTFQWRLAQFNNQLGDVGETIGGALIPVMQALLEKIVPVLEKVADWINENPKLAWNILLVATGVAWLTFAVSMLAPVIWTIITVLTGMWTALWLVGAVWLWPLWLLIIGITALIALFWLFRWSAGETTVTIWNLTTAISNSSQATVDAQNALDEYNQYKIDNSANIAELERLRVKAVELQNQLIATLKAQQALAQKAMQQDQASAQSWQAEGAGAVAWFWNQALIDYWNATVWIINAQQALVWLEHKASWWSVRNWRAYQVGEQWPEMFVPKTNGQIIPNDKMWWQNININMGGVVVNDQADENRLVQKISDMLKRQNQLYSLGIN